MPTIRIHTKYLILLRLVFALAVFGCINLRAEAPFDELKAKLDQALDKNAREVASDRRKAGIDKMYLERLAALGSEFLDQGSLDGALAVRDEIQRFENSGGVPSAFSQIGQLARYQRIYANEIKKIESDEMVGALRIYNAYEGALLQREEELVRQGFIDQAVAVRKERDRAKRLISQLSRGRAELGSIRPEDVFARPRERETAVPTGDDWEAVGDNDNLPNEALDTLKAQFEQSLTAHRESVAAGEQEMFKKYMRELRVREFHYQNNGSLDGVLALRAERKRLQDTGAISTSDTELSHLRIVQRNFTQDLMRLKSGDRERLVSIQRQHLEEMGELERSLVKKRRINEATAVRAERKRVADLLTELNRKALVRHLYEASPREEATASR